MQFKYWRLVGQVNYLSLRDLLSHFLSDQSFLESSFHDDWVIALRLLEYYRKESYKMATAICIL